MEGKKKKKKRQEGICEWISWGRGKREEGGGGRGVINNRI